MEQHTLLSPGESSYPYVPCPLSFCFIAPMPSLGPWLPCAPFSSISRLNVAPLDLLPSLSAQNTALLKLCLLFSLCFLAPSLVSIYLGLVATNFSI